MNAKHDYLIPTHYSIPNHEGFEIRHNGHAIGMQVPDQVPYYMRASEIIEHGLAIRELRNPLFHQLAEKLPEQLQGKAFTVHRFIDLEIGTDCVGVQFFNKDGMPVLIRGSFADFPSEQLIGQLTLLLA